jgi:beta-N-acetylhexosaminidase
VAIQPRTAAGAATVHGMEDTGFSRRHLLAGAGLTAAAAGLAACSSGEAPVAPKPSATRSSSASTPTPSRTGAAANDAALRRKIASLLVVGFRGEHVTSSDWIMRAIREQGLGGVILFDRDQITRARRNISSPAQVTSLIRTLRAASPGRLIVSIDQEGGQISRLNPGDGFPATRSEAQIGAINSAAATQAWAQGIAHTLRSIGVTLNFAPVCDMNVNPSNPAIGQLGRSFSANPNVVAADAGIEVKAHRAAGVRTSLKHFPGFGSATGNTDFGIVDVTKTWRSIELQPFQKLIAAGLADSVLVAHLLNRHLDPSRPTSLSHAVVHDLLRGRLRFAGPVVSDDMQAVAITSKYGAAEAAMLALQAGVDLLVYANQQVYDPKIVDKTVATVFKLVRGGQLSEAQLDQSVARVNTLRPAGR